MCEREREKEMVASKETHKQTPTYTQSYTRLIVVLQGHGDDIDGNDEGDNEVQVVVSAQRVDH